MNPRRRRHQKRRRQAARAHIGHLRLQRHWERKGWEVVDFGDGTLLNSGERRRFTGCWAQLFVQQRYVAAVRLW